MKRKVRPGFILYAIVFSIPFIVFHKALSAGFVWDDLMIISNAAGINNPYHGIFSLPWIKGSFFRPIPTVTIQLDYLLWGATPFGYHLTNLLIHCLSAVLVFTVMKKLTNTTIALASAVLFSVHPAVTEVVSWISCRFDLLALFFALLAMLCVLEYVTSGRKILILLMLVFSVFSIFSKENGVMLVMLLPILFYYKNTRSRKSLYLFIVISIVFFSLFSVFLWHRIEIIEHSYLKTCLYFLKLSGLYTYKLFTPHYLSPFSNCLIAGLGDMTIFLGAGFLLIFLISFVFLLKKRQIPALSIVWFLFALFPGLYISMVKYYRLPGSDRFMYSSMPAAGLLFFYYLYRYLNKKAFLSVAAIVILLGSIYSFKQSSIWLNSYHLWSNVNRQCREKWAYPFINYAHAVYYYRDRDMARDVFRRFLKKINSGKLYVRNRPEKDLYRLNATVWLAKIEDESRRYQEAEDYYNDAIMQYKEVLKKYPGIIKWELGWVNYELAEHYIRQYKLKRDKQYLLKALKEAEVAVKFRPRDPKMIKLKIILMLKLRYCNEKSYNSLYKIYAETGDKDELKKFIYIYNRVCRDENN